jgi:SAM-dependent methyltransferase
MYLLLQNLFPKARMVATCCCYTFASLLIPSSLSFRNVIVPSSLARPLIRVSSSMASIVTKNNQRRLQTITFFSADSGSSGIDSNVKGGSSDSPTISRTRSNANNIFERVLENPQWPDRWPYTPSDFMRQDESNDAYFYQQPRLVYHIDDEAVSALTAFYSEVFQDGQDVLDICSSWVSHYPKGWKGGNVVGLGMNEYELSQNPQLSSFVVQDLNERPKLPFDDGSFDIVTCVVSIDYLNQPLEVMREVARVLRPGGVCLCTLSNRCFPTKAFRIWLMTNDLEHIFIVGSFFHYTGMFEPPSCQDISPNPGRTDPLFIVKAQKKVRFWD